jgi:alpha,alpha-trehalose phosphorylase
MSYRLNGRHLDGFTYGFGGLRDYDGILSFRPQRSPEARSSLRFPLTYCGRVLDVEINPDSTTYTMREEKELVIRHEDEMVTLTRQKLSVIPPNVRP